MNLRDQLKEILPDILPRNPNEAIKGTELIESVKFLLKQEYSDATLRYHFSIMSCDPSSPIAKVAQGQGYYLRTETIHSMNSAMNMIPSTSGEEQIVFTGGNSDLAITRANKFRAIARRYVEANGMTPFCFEESFSKNALANRWRIPDLAVVNWMPGENSEDGIRLDRHKLEVLRQLGKTPIEISCVKLRLELNEFSVCEDLHQCLATSEWANGGEIIVAAAIEDPNLLERVREFANRYGIGVISFGLNADIIDDLPEPAAIDNLSPDEFASIRTLFNIQRHATPRFGNHFNWQYVSKCSRVNEDFDRFERWISKCLIQEAVISPRDFLHEERLAAVGEVAVA